MPPGRSRPPSPRLADELADSEGEGGEPLDGTVEMPGNHGRVISVADVWRLALVQRETKRGVHTAAIGANVTTFLEGHPWWAGVVQYDEFHELVVTTRVPPWDREDMPVGAAAGAWTDDDSARLRAWFSRVEGIDFPLPEIEAGLQVAAQRHRFHPVRAYLRGLEWDGVPRIDTWLSDLVGADDTPYARAVGSRWLVSAVARIMRPGCQVDCMLVLEGAQGTGKTSTWRSLVPVREWYSDTPLDLATKDALDALRGVWIVGLDELDSLRKGELTRVKTYISQTRDRYRRPYGHRHVDFERQNVFCGTTNEAEYLVDRTGNRRFWPVRVGGPIEWGRVAALRDQLWAEALSRFDSGESWHVNTPVLRRLCEAEQSSRAIPDPWTGLVRTWIEGPVERMAYRNGVTTADVLEQCLGVRRADVEVRHSMRVASCLRELGFVRERLGRDWVYVRPADPADA